MSDSIFPDVRAMDCAYSAVVLSRVFGPASAEALTQELLARLARPQPDEGGEVRHG
ncbi:hypothetical protein [Delftia tsuruhatensis]|uniref:hypothetical protein n=1 Tax=Delftia tsuruhatensis TaxID=180282 RepID=UPI002091131A|nr:hypothetical protein [Delftia tsuruhatensis]MCO5338273.1 hypothetical protein [Delftia tsuruhatensis]MCR4545671.1 hypothetical protein [Delftia tsuruhatensis]